MMVIRLRCQSMEGVDGECCDGKYCVKLVGVLMKRIVMECYVDMEGVGECCDGVLCFIYQCRV